MQNLNDIFNSGRLFLFAGHYGSGKTEVAVNFALALSRLHRTAIADFDIVNPYFRTADARVKLEASGIRVITPIFANTNVDVPALPADIVSLFEDKQVKAVFDVGGDSAGAKAISRYHDDFIEGGAANFFVFNIRRPMTSSVEMLYDIFHEIQEAARLPFTALVNNTNLLGATGEPQLLEGLDAALALSEQVALPIAFSTCMIGKRQEPAGVSDGYPAYFARLEQLGIPLFGIGQYIKMP